MKQIALTQGKVALVDDDDYERLVVHKWYAYRSGNTFYARRNIWIGKKKQTVVQMHRDILGCYPGDGRTVDHKNFNGLHNWRGNLRSVSHGLNAYRRLMLKNNTSGYIGVSFKKKKRLWNARITVKGKVIQCGSSKNILIAARKRDKAAMLYYGKDAVLNFPGDLIE